MKNQVNKKVSKLLIALLSLVIMSVACVSFAACNKECTHSKITDGVDTATCIAGGFITHTCDDCGYTYMTATPAKQHTYGTAEKVAATCTEKGYTVATCELCGYELKSEFVDALGHAETETTTTAATCTKDGSEIVKCKDCGQIISVTPIAATGHTYTVKTTVAATCGTDGYIVKECTACGDQITEKGDLATGEHTFTTTSESPATCTEMGLKVQKCDVCGEEHTEVLPKVEHTYSVKSVAATCAVKAHKEKVCDVCGYTEAYEFTGELAAHDYKTVAETFATCVTAGKKVETCKVCGDEKVTETPATGEHTYGEAGAAVAATCVSEGYTPYTCTVCKTVLKKNVTPALGHEFDVEAGATVTKTVAATCTTAGYDHVKCARCDVQTIVAGEDALGHDYVVEKEVAASCLTEGYTLKVCANCDISKKTDIVAATGHNFEVAYTKTATCTTDGEKLYDCAVCGAQKKEVLTAAGHTWGDPTTINATCTEPEYQYNTCEVCGTKSELQMTAPALNPVGGHTFETEVLEAANCYQTGKALNTCTVCAYSEEVVLGLTEHTYHIADAIMDGTIADLETEYPALYKKYTTNGADYYCTVTSVSCTTSGTVIAKCDYCEARYTAGSEAALGHNFVTTIHEATCYNEGYTVLECTRCHYEAGVRSAVTDMLAHQMTVVSNEAGNPDLVLYATNTVDGLKIYRNELLTNELTAAEFCNVFYKAAKETATTAGEVEYDHYVFFCDACHNDLGKEYIAAATRTETDYVYTDPTTNEKYVVYATTAAAVTDTTEASVEHVYSDEADAVDSDALVCEAERKEIFYCVNCKAEDRQYNQTAFTTNSETNKVENTEGHFADVAYVWHYHELPGVPTTEGYWFDRNEDEVQDADEYINTMTGAACVADATYAYGCKVCGVTLANDNKVDKLTITGTNINDVYTAWLESLTEEEKAAEEEKGYVILTQAMMSSEALGHNFDVENGATYAVKAYNETTGNYTDRTCNENEKLVVVILCPRCGEINYKAEEGTYEGDKFDIATAEKFNNVAHGKVDATALAEGTFAWSNVVYYAYGEDGLWVENATAETPNAVATVLNPNDGANECDQFDCDICLTAVAQHHYGDRTYAVVDCRNAQLCVYCDVVLKDKSHVVPDNTCYSVKNDGRYYCAVCGEDPDGVALGNVTPHKNLTVNVTATADCTENGAWVITCGCGTVIETGSEVMGLKGATEGELKNIYAQYTAAIDTATDAEGVTTFNADWLVDPANGHVENTTPVTTDPTCTENGKDEYHCTVCDAIVRTETITALGHMTKADVEAWVAANPDDADKLVVVTDATCTTQGVTQYYCQRCYGDGTAKVEVDKVLADALGHDITLTLKTNGKNNCLYGAELEYFGCTRCDVAIDADTNADLLVANALYQAKAKEYLATYSANIADWATWTGDSGILDYVVGEHNFTKFDTKEGNGKVFVKPTTEKMGSAFWICDVPECQARAYVENSVTLEQYFDPTINIDWKETAAKEEAMANVTVKVNGVNNEALALVTADNFDITDAGFAMKDAAVAAVAAAIYEAISADVTGAEVVIGGTTVAWDVTDDTTIATTKTNIENALRALVLSGSALEITITYTPAP